jgi:hypothetical protein
MRLPSLFARWMLGCLLPGCLPSATAEAQVSSLSYYRADLWGNEYRTGYASLDWSNPEDVRGELCLMPGDKGGSPVKVPLRGTNPRDGVLNLTIPAISGLSFAAQPLVFQRGTSGLFYDQRTMVPAWDYALPSTGDARQDDQQFARYVNGVNLVRIPADLRTLVLNGGHGDDATYGVLRGRSTVRYQLRNYDSLGKEQVLALERRNPPFVGDGGYETGIVLAVAARGRLRELRDFLLAEGGGAVFEAPSFEACGAPFVHLRLAVPPLLEFYYVRKLQASGHVVTAYVDVLGAGPGISSFSIDDRRLVQLFNASDVRLEDKDRQLWTMIQRHVRAFAEARRQEFQARGAIARLQRGGGQVFAYRIEIVGPALSECTRNRWEKIVLQVLPQTILNDGKVHLLFQIQEGFFAPGSPDRRPDDSRLQENRIPDGPLEQLQERLGGFLVARGFFSEDDSASANADVGCRF